MYKLYRFVEVNILNLVFQIFTNNSAHNSTVAGVVFIVLINILVYARVLLAEMKRLICILSYKS